MKSASLLIALLCLAVSTAHAVPEVPENWDVRLLPGHDTFVFTLYGAPGEVEKLRQLFQVMEETGLGNGFDPGPAAHVNSTEAFEYLASIGWPCISYPPYGDFQVKDGRARMTDAEEQVLRVFDEAGVFHGIQLGEWGYFFHNLSWSEDWFKGAYGEAFPDYAHLMKDPEFRGYDRLPQSRAECYSALRDYFLTRNRFMRGRNISVTGHSHYEAYAAEWGARVVGLELGENIAFTQSKMAFARGGSRQWNVPWSVQVSPWFHGSVTSRGFLRMEGEYARGLDAGHSLNFYERLWLHSWFAGTAMVTPENSISTFFEETDDYTLSSHGRKAAEVFAFMRAHDRGIPHTPVAIVLDHLAGYNGYQGRPWGIMENTQGDEETRDLFQHQLFPGSNHIHGPRNEENPEAAYIRPTPYGEMFDVILTTARADVLSTYPVILLAGDIDFGDSTMHGGGEAAPTGQRFLIELMEALRAGSTLLLHPRHAEALDDNLARLQGTGHVEVLEEWTNPATDRATAISNDRLAQLNRDLLPIAVEGDPVQYQINRNAKGWVIEVVNNEGVAKTPTQPAVVDPTATATVTLRPKFDWTTAEEWRMGNTFSPGESVQLTLGPGQTAFVEFVMQE